jgi:hypothetical protein
VIDKCVAVTFFVNVYTNKANSSQMDYKVWSHDFVNLLRSYYYVKKVLQFVRSVINIRVKERVYSIFKNKVHIILMQQDAWYKTWYVRGVSYAILMLWNISSVGYLLPSLETFHSTTTERSIRLFTDVAIHEVTWYVIKQKRWRNETAVLPSLNKYSRCYYNKNIRPILGTFCTIMTTPHFLDDESRKKCCVLYSSKYGIWPVRWMIQYFTACWSWWCSIYEGRSVFTSLSPLFLTHKHCHTWPASANESLLVDSTLHPKTESQHINLSWRTWNTIRHIF